MVERIERIGTANRDVEGPMLARIVHRDTHSIALGVP
jgi:hypothetical protein